MEQIISKHLQELPQYFFERGDFCNIIESAYPKFLDDLDDCNNEHLDNFSLFRVEDEFYIIHRSSGTMINWYKHLGRTNTCNKNLSLLELDEFITLLKVDMEKFKWQIQNK